MKRRTFLSLAAAGSLAAGMNLEKTGQEVTNSAAHFPATGSPRFRARSGSERRVMLSRLEAVSV